MTIENAAFKARFIAALARQPREGLSVDLINATADDELAEVVTDALWDICSNEFNHDTDLLLASLPEGARYLCLTSIAEGQVTNGGFAQLYQNGYGRYSEDFVRAFDYFAASKHASLTREANQVYRKNRLLIWIFSGRTGILLRQLFQRDLLASKLPALEGLDSKFYEVDGELDAFRAAKIRAAPESFVPHAS